MDGEPLALLKRLRPWLTSGSEPLVVETSGSTGEPKQVLLGAAAVRASATAGLARLGGPGQWLLALPVRRVAGLQILVRSILAGTDPVLLKDHADLPAAAQAMHADRRYAALVPTQLRRLLDSGEADALRGFDAVLVGGAAAGKGLLQRARAAGVPVVTTYGMTETCGGCVYEGVPLDGVGLAVGDDGRIKITGPVLFSGYLGRPDLTARVLRDGWLTTNDIGQIDDDGRLQVLGRADDVVVSGGVNVGTGAVRDRLLEHPAIRDAAVVGVPDPHWGAAVVAFVVGDQLVPSSAELRDFLSERLPRTWAPQQVIPTDELPLLASGKVDVRALRAAAAPRVQGAGPQ